MIERPWEDSFCEKCTHCFQEDMCNAYNFGMSYAFCPQVRECDRFENKFNTNADRIRAMSDEELRDFLHSKIWLCSSHKLCDSCPLYDEDLGCMTTLEWLKQPAEVDHD